MIRALKIPESGKEHLHVFEEAGRKSSSNFRCQFWEHEYHPVLLETTEMYNQQLNYLHWNPVTAGFVAEPWHWIYRVLLIILLIKKNKAQDEVLRLMDVDGISLCLI